MEFYQRLLLGPKARKRKKEILWKLRRKKPLHNIFLLTFPTNQKNLLDIIPANLLLQPYYKKRNLFILGIAQGKEEALELFARLVEKIYLETGTVKIIDYIAGESDVT